MKEPTEGDIRVWWIPQIPMRAFYVDVKTHAEGARLCEILAAYDDFQLRHCVKPDYSNVGGVQAFENGEWWDIESTAFADRSLVE